MRGITTQGVATRTPGAFLPTLGPTPLASSYGLVELRGGPTSTAVAPAPSAILPQAASTGEPSRGAPNMIRPGMTIVTNTNMQGHVPTRIHNVHPVETPNPVMLPSAAPHQQRVGGVTAVPWPRAVVRWPVYGGGVA